MIAGRQALVIALDEGTANEVASTLADPAVGSFHVRRFAGLDAAELRSEIVQFCGRLDKDDVAMVYIAGTGVIDDAGDAYLMAAGVDLARPESTMVALSTVDKAIRSSSCRHLVVVLDQHLVDLGTGRVRAGALGARDLAYSINQARGKYVLMGVVGGTDSRPAPPVTDIDRVTPHLLDALRGAGDLDDDGLITVGELFDYIHEVMATAGKPVPVRVIVDGGGDRIVASRTVDGPGVNEPGRRTAGFQTRLMARAIDMVVWVLLASPLLLVLNPPPSETGLGSTPFDRWLVGLGESTPAEVQATMYTVLWICLVVYEVAALSRWRKTIGKRMFDLEVILPADAKARFRAAIVRASPLIVGGGIAVIEAWYPTGLEDQLFLTAGLPVDSFEAPVVFTPSIMVIFGLANLPLVIAGRRTLWDRMAATRVVSIARPVIQSVAL